MHVIIYRQLTLLVAEFNYILFHIFNSHCFRKCTIINNYNNTICNHQPVLCIVNICRYLEKGQNICSVFARSEN